MEKQLSEAHKIGTGREFSWKTENQEEFLARVWCASDHPKALVIAVHGLSGAAADFSPLGVVLEQKDWALYSPELRGQGRDLQSRRHGDLGHPREWWRDLRNFVRLVLERHPGVPWFLVGESMGGMIAVHWLGEFQTEFRPKGLLLMAPVVAMNRKPYLWQELLFRGLSRILPKVRVRLGQFAPREGLDLRVTRDPLYQAYLQVSPHHLYSYTLRFVRHLGELILACAPEVLSPKIPVLVLAAQYDVFIYPELLKTFTDKLKATDKTLRIYPDSFHCLIHDLDVELVLAEMTEWMEKRVA